MRVSIVFVPIFVLPLTAHLFVAVADGVPKLDVTPSCRGAAAAKVLSPSVNALQTCLETEKKAYGTLVKEWLEFAPADRAKCVGAVMAFSPTYTELLTCLEFSKELNKNP
jgi:hypothetical protein